MRWRVETRRKEQKGLARHRSDVGGHSGDGPCAALPFGCMSVVEVAEVPLRFLTRSGVVAADHSKRRKLYGGSGNRLVGLRQRGTLTGGSCTVPGAKPV